MTAASPPLFPSSRSRLARTRILHEKTCPLSHSQRQFISGSRLNLFPISGNMMFHQRMGFVSRETYSKRFRNLGMGWTDTGSTLISFK